MSENRTTRDPRQTVRLLRLLHGELPAEEAATLRQHLEQEPALAAEYHRLERVWNGLEAPPATAVPPGFARRTAARIVEREAAASFRWAAAPLPVRAAAAGALLAGILLGVGLGDLVGTTAEEDPVWDTSAVGLTTSSLAEQYWQTLEGEELPALPADEGEPTS